MLEKLSHESLACDHLFVGTDRYMYFTLSWDAQKLHLRTEKTYVDQADKSSRDSQTQDRCLIEPSRQYMALLLYDGIVTILPMAHKMHKKITAEGGMLGDPVPARISDLFIRAATFLYRRRANEKPKMAFLYENSRQKVCLSVRSLEYAAGGTGEPGSADLETTLSSHDDVELGASHLLPVPGPACTSTFAGSFPNADRAL